MDTWIKVAIVLAIGILVYREILKSAVKNTREIPTFVKEKASILSLMIVVLSVGIFVSIGISMTNIETRDLRPYHPPHTPEMISMFDKGVIELNGQYIKTNLAKPKELTTLAGQLTQGCNGNDACEIQKMFDYVTHIPYRTDYTSRNAKEVIRSNWGDCDDKTNLFASLLNERGFDYRFVYVPHHVFMVVHLEDKSALPFLTTKLTIDGVSYYYAETTAIGARIGEFNGQFPMSFEGIYDLRKNKPVDLEKVSFWMG